MNTLILYPLLTTATFYLLARATITQWLWSRYPPRLDAFLNCAACSGFWYGCAVGILGWWRELPFLGMPSNHWLTTIAIGLCSIVWTPLLADLHIQALMRLGGPQATDQDQSNA